MRVLVRVLLTLIGVVILAVGAAAAVFVGPDDTVAVGETEYPGGTAYTAPGLFTAQHVTVTVAAEAADGEVFVGVAHPVDVADVTDGHDAFRITQIELGSLAGAADGGEEPMPDPRGIDYLDSASGTGEQTVSYAVEDLSPQFVVWSPADQAVTTSVWFTVAGTFRLCVAVAAVGLVVLVGGWLLTRRRRRTEDRGQDDVPQGPTDGERTAGEASSTGTPEPPQKEAGVALRRVAATLGAGALVLPLGACAALPEIPEQMATTEVEKVAVTTDDVGALWADYDERNNTAIKAAAAPEYDGSTWKLADTGVLLSGDQYVTTYGKAYSETEEGKKDKDETEPSVITSSGEWVSSPSFTTYPMWAVVHRESVSSADDPAAEDDEPAKFTTAAVVVKEAADAPWKARSLASVPLEYVDELPEVAATPTEEQLAVVDEVVAAMETYFETGKKPELLGDVSGLKFARQQMKEDGDEEWSSEAEWSLSTRLFDDESIHVIPTADALYAVIDQRHTSTLTFPSDHEPYWNPPADAVNMAHENVLAREKATTVLVRIPAEGKADGRGVYLRPVLAGGN